MDVDFDEFFSKLDEMEANIDDDLDTITRNNAFDLSKLAKIYGAQAFNKGYATGFTVGNIEVEKNGQADYSVWSNSGHSGFLEWGTRFMDAAPFLFPAVQVIQAAYKRDLENLVN